MKKSNINPMIIDEILESRELFYDDLYVFFIDNCGDKIKNELLKTHVTEDTIELYEIEDALFKDDISYKNFVKKFNEEYFKIDLLNKVNNKRNKIRLYNNTEDEYFDPYFLIDTFIKYQVKFDENSESYIKLKQILDYSKTLYLPSINNHYNKSDYENSKKKNIADLDECKWYKYFVYDYFDVIFSSNSSNNINRNDYDYFKKYFNNITEIKVVKLSNVEKLENIKINSFIVNNFVNKIIENIKNNFNHISALNSVTCKLSYLYIFEGLDYFMTTNYGKSKFSRKLMDEIMELFNSSSFSKNNNIKLEYLDNFCAVFYPYNKNDKEIN